MAIDADVRHELVAAFEIELEEFAAVANAPGSDLPGLAARPTPTELARIEARNWSRLREVRDRVYTAAVSRREAANLLDVSTNQITNLVSADDLIALDGPDGQRLPAWQFNLDGSRVRLPGVARVARAYPAGVVGLSVWMTTPLASLGGSTPAARLADGDVDAVIAAAEAIGT